MTAARAADTATLRVASVPSGHPYVENLAPLAGPADVSRLPDPTPAGAAPGQWWPPVVLDGAWIRASRDAFDLLHVHFGTESYDAAHLRDVVAALRETGTPLVYTVHDLSNPQLAEQAAHDEHLGVLIPAADVLITLTPGAAAEIRRRWGRDAAVVAHPFVWPLDRPAPVGTPSAPLVVGVSLRDLRPNIDAVRAVATLLAAAARVRSAGTDVEVRVDANERVRDVAARDRLAALVAGAPFATFRAHPRPSDDELAADLADLDVAVLPYGHGTHSGWVELCWDLGVRVAGPDVGYAREQHPDAAFFASFAAGDAVSLAASLQGFAADASARPGSEGRHALQRHRRDERARENATIAAAHRDLYALALARRA